MIRKIRRMSLSMLRVKRGTEMIGGMGGTGVNEKGDG